MKIKYWCNSGANIHSCRKGEISLEELGISPEEWRNMTDEQKDDTMRPIVFERLDWGYTEE